MAGCLRMHEDLTRRTVLDDGAAREDHDARGVIPREIVVVRREEERPPLGRQRRQRVAELVPARRIERRGRLVHEEKRRVHGEGPRDRHALRLAAGELARLRTRAGGDAEPLEERVRPRLRLGARMAQRVDAARA